MEVDNEQNQGSHSKDQESNTAGQVEASTADTVQDVSNAIRSPDSIVDLTGDDDNTCLRFLLTK